MSEWNKLIADMIDEPVHINAMPKVRTEGGIYAKLGSEGGNPQSEETIRHFKIGPSDTNSINYYAMPDRDAAFKKDMGAASYRKALKGGGGQASIDWCNERMLKLGLVWNRNDADVYKVIHYYLSLTKIPAIVEAIGESDVTALPVNTKRYLYFQEPENAELPVEIELKYGQVQKTAFWTYFQKKYQVLKRQQGKRNVNFVYPRNLVSTDLSLRTIFIDKSKFLPDFCIWLSFNNGNSGVLDCKQFRYGNYPRDDLVGPIDETFLWDSKVFNQSKVFHDVIMFEDGVDFYVSQFYPFVDFD